MGLNEKLILVCIHGNLSEVKKLVKNGTDIHMANDSPLRNAAGLGYLDVVKYLVESGANIHADEGTPLINAVAHGHLEIVKYLVEHGADIHVNRDFPLRHAAIHSHLELATYLRKVAGKKWKCYNCLVSPTCLKLCKGWNYGYK